MCLSSVRNFAIQSRVFVVVLQALFNFLIPDHNANVFSPPPTTDRLKIGDHIVDVLLGGFRRWDAVYFLHISEHGYSYENTLAFFPLFPLLVNIVANSVLFPLQYCMNFASVLLVSSAILNFFCFTLSAVVLYKLGKLVLGSDNLAYRAAQLYCVNPASIFFSAPYSESCYALLAFSGMLAVENQGHMTAAVYFGASGAARSNGLVNIGFILHRVVHNTLQTIRQIVSSGQWRLHQLILFICSVFFKSFLQVIVCILPFTAFEYYAYSVFCNPFASYRDLAPHIRRYGTDQGYKMPYTGLSSWCRDRLPLSYSYVQSHHWGVGLFRYYELKQLPNFLLATPMIIIGFCTVLSYVCRYKTYTLTLGLWSAAQEPSKKFDDQHFPEVQHLPASCLVYVAHLLFLLTFGMLCMHIQVITRFIASSSPVIYWFLAIITLPKSYGQPPLASLRCGGVTSAGENVEKQKNITDCDILNWESTWPNKAIFVYFIFYIFVGIAAFSNFLPWT